MKCVDKNELEQFLQGKLTPERLLAVDEHVGRCADCKSALNALPRCKNAGVDLGAALLGVSECPDYEELSAFVDGALSGDRAKKTTAGREVAKEEDVIVV